MLPRDLLRGDPLPWLLEPDPANPGVRYFALRDLLDRSPDDPEVRQARKAVMATGPVPAILAAQHPDGFWDQPGVGYSPKYRGTTWQIMFLAELGADPADERVRLGCEYLLRNNPSSSGAFSLSVAPRGGVHCLNGNLLAALMSLGYAGDPRVQAAFDWLVRAITGEGEIRFYASGTSGPGFACGINLGQPCGWGANKALKALVAVPAGQRTGPMQRAIAAGVEFLFSRDPALADYPYTQRVSSTWFKFGFPLSYWSDVLETAGVLAAAGYGGDPRLVNAIRFILGKQDAQGRWKLENTLNEKMWADIEQRGRPSKWVTLRALRVLTKIGMADLQAFDAG
ncbi:MAG TPA: hypothetical protein VF498_15065 [Anaerolineales bacterium]